MRRRAAADPAEVECAAPDCTTRFVPKRSTAKYHSATCRQRAARTRRAAPKSKPSKLDVVDPAAYDGHELVNTVRRELERVSAIDTVEGQLALEFARRILVPEQTAVATISKELRLMIAEAKAAVLERTGAGDAAAKPEPPDQVGEARRRRQAIAAKARKAGG